MAAGLECSEELELPEQDKEAFRSLCSHYSRACSLVAPCCGKVYPCRLCHNEQESSHEIDRYAVKEIVCRNCSKKQPVCENCEECAVRFGRYTCTTCRLYDDADKGQFHCSKCGLCRVGGKEKFFHCDTCGFCLANSMRDTHLCRKEASKANCPICMEDLHTSRDAPHVPKCGHLIHSNCYHQMARSGLYQCPLCYSSLMEMGGSWAQMDRAKTEWIMPLHLRNFMVKIQCRDCRKEADTDFHVIGLKCRECGSYNTVRCGSEEFPDDNHNEPEPAELPQLLNRLIFMGAQHSPNESSENEDSDVAAYSSTQSWGEGGEGGDPVPALESDTELRATEEGGGGGGGGEGGADVLEDDGGEASPLGLDSNSDNEMIVSSQGDNEPRQNGLSDAAALPTDSLPVPNEGSEEEEEEAAPVISLPEPVGLSDSASYDGDQSDEGEEDDWSDSLHELDEDAPPIINPYLPSSGGLLNPVGDQSSSSAAAAVKGREGGGGGDEATGSGWWEDVVVITDVQDLVLWGNPHEWSNADSPSHSSLSDQSDASWVTEEEEVMIGGDPEAESNEVGVVSVEEGGVASGGGGPAVSNGTVLGESGINAHTCSDDDVVGVASGCGQGQAACSSEGEWETAKEELI